MEIIPNTLTIIATLNDIWSLDAWWMHWLVFTGIVLIYVFGLVIGFIWFERRAMARMQARLGPNRIGPFGTIQPIADMLKVLTKENIVPVSADKIVHFLAPLVAFIPVMMTFAVIPFGNGAMLADLNIGILFIVAFSSITGIGIFMAGWGSNNKYALIGAMRHIAGITSYEIPIMLSMAGVVLMTGSMSLNDIVLAQNIPFILLQPVGFFILFLGWMAEINRAPFDLLEAESEIVAGYNTEYSGMKFAMFYLVEYAEALFLSTVITIVYLGGWRGPLLPPWLWILVKVWAVFFIIVWIRTTVPRFRIDQMMHFAWLSMLPLAFINLIVTAVQSYFFPGLPWVLVPVNYTLAVILFIIWSKFFRTGWGRVELGPTR